ncbi:MAG: hypothetical protein HYY20_12625 [Candidatus Tectomicrobia bacterium]|uniref:Uncharacterized protein n=1 Tax=Tectimicrobiota bacterium TaxID=2528274 RepID=A0A932CRB5_UNCTE|nr:hypothetical protein [Candidatus Tectomicrobia bacterium]
MLANRFDLSEEEEVRVELVEEGGHPLVSLWVYRKTEEGIFVPSGRGLKVPCALFRPLKEAVLGLEKALAERGLERLPEESAASPSEKRRAAFAHPSEAELARLLDFYQIHWLYEPHSFPIAWDHEGNVIERFTPDFYLPDHDLYLELTTMKQSLVTKKNKKVRRLRELYPEVKIKILYGKDYQKLLLKYGRGREE